MQAHQLGLKIVLNYQLSYQFLYHLNLLQVIVQIYIDCILKRDSKASINPAKHRPKERIHRIAWAILNNFEL